MIKEEYSPYKIVHHQDRLNELKAGFQTNPLLIQLIPTNACNFRCKDCAYRLEGNPSNEIFSDRETLSWEKIDQILVNMVEMNIPALEITGGGEPSIHPQFDKLIKRAFEIHREVALVSNGSNLSEEICEILGNASWVRISLDSATAKTHSKTKQVKEEVFNKVINTIKNLVRYRRKVIIGIGFVVTPDNYHEIIDAALLARDLGVDNIRFSAAFTPRGFDYFKEIYNEARRMAKETEKLNSSSFRVFNLFNDRISDLFIGGQEYEYCPMKELMTYIGADYNVYTCCTLAYNKKGLIGSIKEQSFKELWYSEKKKNFFKKHNAKKICDIPCLYRNKNEFINYCLRENPRHVNFI
ncbi:MAG: radical SAM/SPASM domain-containing protein [Candidatus Njordarchaeia archaeon]